MRRNCFPGSGMTDSWEPGREGGELGEGNAHVGTRDWGSLVAELVLWNDIVYLPRILCIRCMVMNNLFMNIWRQLSTTPGNRWK